MSKNKVRLSQCMIVKDEEKNIQRALAWAKPVAFEQIVVDTGSTDKTVELAEAMGAKVYHFEWIKDFSAAKNYAIEQATGDWIAFLDADEYLSPEDTKKLTKKLETLENNSNTQKSINVINMPWVHLNDNGEAMGINTQTRLFRNIKEIRYIGRIHEQISVYGKITEVNDISIMHTGYSETEHKEKGKSQRNIDLLRIELEKNPDDITKKAYLADSLQSKNILDNYSNEEETTETDALFMEVIETNEYIPEFLKKKAYMHHIGRSWEITEKREFRDSLCKKAYETFPDDLDIGYYYSIVLNNNKEYAKAWDLLKRMESQLKTGTGHISGASARIQSNLTMIFGQLLTAAQGLGDLENTINYATVMLASDKTQQNILSPYIRTLLQNGISEEEVLGLLSKIYDISSPNDLLLIARCAKDGGSIEFARMIMTIAGELMG